MIEQGIWFPFEQFMQLSGTGALLSKDQATSSNKKWKNMVTIFSKKYKI
jgi:hypothetical protein